MFTITRHRCSFVLLIILSFTVVTLLIAIWRITTNIHLPISRLTMPEFSATGVATAVLFTHDSFLFSYLYYCR